MADAHVKAERRPGFAAAQRYRFPPLQSLLDATAAAAATVDSGDAFQQGYQEGFQLGQERGYEEGLQGGIEQGRQQGLREGFTRGQTEGEAQGRAAFEAAMAPLARLGEEMERVRLQQLVEHTDSVCALVAEVARRVIHAELTLNPRQILALVEEAMQRLEPTPAQLSIYLSDQDAERLAKIGVRELAGHRLLVDAELGLGDCRIETETAELAVTTEQRLEQYIDSFKNEFGQIEAMQE